MPYRPRSQAAVVTASDLPAVFAALLGACGDVPPASSRVSPGAPLEVGRPAPTAVGTGRTQSFDMTQPSEEEVSCA